MSNQQTADAKWLLAAAKKIQADIDASGLGPRTPDPARLRLLEAVAEAARADARAHLAQMFCESMSLAEYLARYGDFMSDGRPMLEALAALEAYDEKPNAATTVRD